MDCVILASGSKGNAIYIGNGTDAVVVDAGLGYLARRAREYGLQTDIIRSLLVTHEHADHIRTAKAFLKELKIPVCASGGTLDMMKHASTVPPTSKRFLLREDLIKTFGSLSITTFRTHHDAAEPTGYIIDDGDARIGVCTDTCRITGHMKELLKTCDALVLESNYSEYAIKHDYFTSCHGCRSCGAECRGCRDVGYIYPQYLKDRIISTGHLSNEKSSEIIGELKDSVGIFALAHLSENYNRPNIARISAENSVGESGADIFVSDQFPFYRERRIVKFSV